MTVENNSPVSGPFIANGVIADFPFSFKVVDAAHMVLRIVDANGLNARDVVSGFTIDPQYIGSDTGGYVRYLENGAPLPAGLKVYPYRKVPYEQPNRIGNQGRFFPETHEKTFDLVVMQIQQINETISRSLTVDIGQEPPDVQSIYDAAASAAVSAGEAASSAQDAQNSEDAAFGFKNDAAQSASDAQAAKDYVVGGWSAAVHAAALKANPSLLDEFGFSDSGDSWKIKKQTFARLQEVFGVPIGSTIMVQGNGNTPPPGFLLHNGAAVTAAYPQLRAFLLANGAAVNGNGDPIIEDMGGYFPRGWRPGQVVDSGRVFGSVQQDAMEYHEHPTIWEDTTNPLAGPAPTNSENQKIYATRNAPGTFTNVGGSGNNNNGRLRGTGRPMTDAATQSRTASETRPINKTFTYWIKAYAADLVPGSADFAALANDVQALKTRATTLEQRDVIFESVNQSYVLSGSGAVAHSLGFKPSKIVANLVCTAVFQGWQVGDAPALPAFNYYNNATYGIALWADTTNIYWKLGAQGTVIVSRVDGVTYPAPVANFALRLLGAR